MTDSHLVIIAKSNCGIPEFRGTEIEYSGDPALMGRYAGVAIDSGATIIGGCCGTSPEHLVRMREALDTHRAGPAPTLEMIVNALGELVNTVATDDAEPSGRGRRSRRRPG
jgi:5-methyltetrahydrofolate--homocysteine methyltransferase